MYLQGAEKKNMVEQTNLKQILTFFCIKIPKKINLCLYIISCFQTVDCI